MKVLSLFDGMACGRLALERAGVQVDSYYASEVDKYAIKVAQANYPDIQQVGDITQLHWDGPEIDLMIGGSPCQGFSTGGSHLAFDDPRSKLFWEFIRLLDWVDPRWFLLENVRMKKEHENIITKYMGVDPVEVNSSLVSAQNRKRLYWTNIPFTVPEDRGIMLKDIIEDGVVDREKSHCLDAHYAKGGNAAYYFKKHRRQVVFKDREMLPTSRYRMLTPLECERLQTVPEGYTAHVSNSQRYKMLGNGWTVDVVAPIFNCLYFLDPKEEDK
jgi:site-specific DNA-cytosine methylase